MTTLRSQAATIAQRLSDDKDVTEADIVELARIVAKANPKDVPAWADANPRGFAVAGYTAKQPRRSGWIAAAKVIQHFPLDRDATDPIGTDVRGAWDKATSLASITNNKRMEELGREFAKPDAFVIVGKGNAERAEDVTTQGNAYRWIQAQYRAAADAKAKGKKGAKVQNSETSTPQAPAKRTEAAIEADIMADFARLSDDGKRRVLNAIIAQAQVAQTKVA